jgi:Flp pilus assembly protein TadB
MSNKMQPTVPEQAHTRTPVARSASMEFDDSNSRQQKRSLTTMESVSAEWKSGSKRRVIKYYVVYMGIGLVVGAIIGVVVGVCVRFI